MNTQIIYSYYPAEWHKNLWREGFCAGNGKTGINTIGAICNDFFVITRTDLWYGLKKAELPDVSYKLKEMRVLRKNNEFKKADGLICDELKAKGYNGSCSAPMPLCQLNVTAENGGYFTDYVRKLDMSVGEISSSWIKNGVKYQKKAFVSQLNDVAYLQITCEKADNFSFSLSKRDDTDSRFPCPEEINPGINSAAENDHIAFSGKNSDDKYFGCVALIKTDGECITLPNAISVKNAKTITVLLKAVANEKKFDGNALLSVLRSSRGYEAEFSLHSKAFAKLYNGTDLNLYRGKPHSNEELLLSVQKDEVSAELIEKLYRFGRYLFISGTAEKGLPFSQYGIWCGDYSAVWAQNVLNENLELIYEHVFNGNLINSLLPVFDYFDNSIEEYRTAAKRLFGCRGIAIHAYSCPGMGSVAVNVPVIVNWTGAGAWIASFYCKYYDYTRDEKFLKTRALPFLKEVCLFYSDFIYFNGNKAEVYPSVSPENSPANFINEGDTLSHPMPSAINAAMDVALIKEVINNYIRLSKIAEIPVEEKEKLEKILNGLPDYETEDGALKEWCYKNFKENHDHRHFSHLYPLWPGDEITEENPFYDACATAIEKRTANGLQHQSGWSLTHLSSLYCRLKDGNKALNCLKFLIKGDLMKNFFTVHNDWRGMGLSMHVGDACTVQLDANMGFLSAVQEMLIRCTNGKTEILPALPDRFIRGNVKNLRVIDGTVSIDWNKTKGVLKVKTSSSLPIDLPCGFSDVTVIRQGIKKRYSFPGKACGSRTLI